MSSEDICKPNVNVVKEEDVYVGRSRVMRGCRCHPTYHCMEGEATIVAVAYQDRLEMEAANATNATAIHWKTDV